MPTKSPAYDRAFAENALGQIEPIMYGCNTGFPLGNRTVSRNADLTTEYEMFQPIQNLPRKQREMIRACMNAYSRIGLLRNVIDMMSSFGCQGIQIMHPAKSREKIYKSWWNRVQGPQRSERFLNGLYKAGNVVVKKTVAKLTAADIRDLQRSYADTGPDADYERAPRIGRNEIPVSYTFLNPSLIETAGGDLATFLGHPVYVMRIPNFIITMVTTPKGPSEEKLVADLPAYIRNAVKAGEKFVKLDNDKLAVYHYMKDDWQQWAMPITYSILDDLVLYHMMKRADMSALRGAISHIRLWILGNLEHGIQVGPAMYDKLQQMLQSNVGGGAMDLLWDAAIDLKETSTDVAKFLGSEKYEPVLRSIYAALGIPASLTGSSPGGAGFTNNAISLKTLIERLQYGRELLTDFWNKELKVLQEAFGDAHPAQISFDNMSLYDEAAEKMLWFQMYDRQLVDDATMQEKFGLVPEIIQMRVKREETQRKNGKKPPRAGAFHDPQSDHELTKIALQQGTLAPTEAGVEKLPKAPNDKSILDVQTEQAAKDRKLQQQQQEAQNEMNKQKLQQGDDLHNQQLQHNEQEHQLKMKHMDTEHKAMLPIKKDALKKKTTLQLQNQKKGVPGQGRPKNSKDTQKRKQKRVVPNVKAFEVYQWAKEAQKGIAVACNSVFLAAREKKNLRSLTTAQSEELEEFKFRVLCMVPPLLEDSELGETIAAALDGEATLPLPEIGEADSCYRDLLAAYTARKGVSPSIDERRDMQASAYAAWQSAMVYDSESQ